MITMTQKKAAAAVRAGLTLAKQFPERWNPSVFLGWLTDTGYSGVEWDNNAILPADRRGACGCTLGLGALAYAKGKMPLKTVDMEVLPAMEEALGHALYARISAISCGAESVDDMITKVESALVECDL